MSKYKFKKTPIGQFEDSEDQDPPALYPEIFSINELKTDKQLPYLKNTNLKKKLTTQKQFIDISTEVPNVNKNTDLFLFINNKKKDMYYQVPGGMYTFREVNLIKGKNLVELFYRVGRKKSSSIYFEINRE